jgi:excisionase family DNA binding protein
MTTLADDLLKGARAAAQYVGLPEKQIYYLVEKGALPVKRLGTRVLYFRKSDLDRAFSPNQGEVA